MVDVFVLGVERSATTWISNILEAHPNTCVYMEPLSRTVSGLKSWPRRFTKISDLDSYAKYFRQEFRNLRNRRRFLFTRYFDAGLAWKVDSTLATFVDDNFNVSQASDFLELNFHRLNEDFKFPSKESSITVVKEVRLNYNVDLTKKINQDSKVIVPIRGYAPVIKSIKRHFKKGALVELKEDLMSRFGDIGDRTIFKYWVSSYNKILKSMDSKNISYKILYHENYIQDVNKIFKVFDWLGLVHSESTRTYVKKSSQHGEGRHTTQRSHTNLLERAKKAEIEMEQRYSFKKEYEDRDVHHMLDYYLKSSK